MEEKGKEKVCMVEIRTPPAVFHPNGENEAEA